MAFVTIICGGQGTGKTTFAKNLIVSPQRTIVLDVNNEYAELDKKGVKRIVKDFRGSLESVKELSGICLVVEEATVFFSNRKYDENLQEMIIRKRHQKNDIYLIYHSLTDIPDYLLRIADYLVLFKTKDNTTNVENKYKAMPEIKKLYYEVRVSKKPHANRIIKLLK